MIPAPPSLLDVESVRRYLQRFVTALNDIHDSVGMIRVESGADEAIASATANPLTQWDAETSHGWITASASGGPFTIGRDGRYRVEFHVRATLSGGTTINAMIYVNSAASSPKIEDQSNASGTDHDLAGCGCLDLVAGDVVELRVYPAGNVNINAGNNGATVLMVQRLS